MWSIWMLKHAKTTRQKAVICTPCGANLYPLVPPAFESGGKCTTHFLWWRRTWLFALYIWTICHRPISISGLFDLMTLNIYVCCAAHWSNWDNTSPRNFDVGIRSWLETLLLLIRLIRYVTLWTWPLTPDLERLYCILHCLSIRNRQAVKCINRQAVNHRENPCAWMFKWMPYSQRYLLGLVGLALWLVSGIALNTHGFFLWLTGCYKQVYNY